MDHDAGQKAGVSRSGNLSVECAVSNSPPPSPSGWKSRIDTIGPVQQAVRATLTDTAKALPEQREPARWTQSGAFCSLEERRNK